MKAFLDVLEGLGKKDKEDCVLVTIVSADGSTPGRTGAMMIVTRNGRRFGTIGGGAVELKSIQLAQKLLGEKRCHLERFRLHPNETSDIGMICGGENDVYFRYIAAEDAAAADMVEKSLSLLREGKPFWMITDITEGGNGRFTLYVQPEKAAADEAAACADRVESADCAEPDGLEAGVKAAANEQAEDGSFPASAKLAALLTNVPQRLEADGRTWFAMPMTDTGKVYLFGAGHISQALAPLLAKLDFLCGVYDDRPEFLELECFEGIDTVRINPEDISEITEKITAADYICIMTHGHKDDFEVQRQVMKTPARYIGVIGSARKQKAVKEKILALGFTEEDFANVVSPIGLNIGANSPQEIAVCIAAQLIMIRAGRGFGERDWKR